MEAQTDVLSSASVTSTDSTNDTSVALFVSYFPLFAESSMQCGMNDFNACASGKHLCLGNEYY